MTWRTIVISNRAKLDLKMNHLVVRQMEDYKKVYLGEVGVVVLETTAVSITSALLNELAKRNIAVIVCDEKRNPSACLQRHGTHFEANRRLHQQMSWPDDVKRQVWTEIVKNKIYQQSKTLSDYELENASKVLKLMEEVQLGDMSNREGHASKIYWHTLYGKGFSRGMDCPVNAALNYGYAIILSLISREITASGYLTQLGVGHDNVHNPFNFSSDLIEPFRCIVDRYVYESEIEVFDKTTRYELLNLLNKEVVISDKRNTVTNSIQIYCRSVFKALNEENLSLMRFYEYGV